MDYGLHLPLYLQSWNHKSYIFTYPSQEIPGFHRELNILVLQSVCCTRRADVKRLLAEVEEYSHSNTILELGMG